MISEDKDTELKTRLAAISRVFDVNEVTARRTTTESIKKYYRINRLGYWFFYSRDGFIHMGLSNGDTFTEQDLAAPAKLVSSLIKKHKAANVLELAMGKGANMRLLASEHPGVTFYGIDLPAGQLNARSFAHIPNAKVEYGNYHDLSRYLTGSMDIVFVIESLCYSPDKPKVLREVKRVLKRGGLFIVFDGYNSKAVPEYSDEELLAIKLMWKGMAGDINDFDVSTAEPLFKNNGFKIIKADDLSQQILPSIDRLEKISAKFFRHPGLARIVIRLVPKSFSANVISGYLMTYTIRHKLVQYRLIVTTNK